MADNHDDLGERVELLELVVSDLKAAIRDHIVTSRLTVVDESGDRITLAVMNGVASVAARVPGTAESTGVELYAYLGECGPELGYGTFRDGNCDDPS